MEAIVEDSQNPDGKCCIKAKATGHFVDALPDNTMWIPYRTPYLSDQAGAVLLPNKNDHVALIYSENSKRIVLIIQSIRICVKTRITIFHRYSANN